MVHDLCIIMLTAAIVSILFKLLRQPVVLGYIVAGMLVGPHLLGGTWLTDTQSVETWGQIGVLFLLFALGLEFSFKKLIAVGGTAIIAAIVILTGMLLTGFLAGRCLGLNELNSLFLGAMLSMSSTTIVFKALDDMGLREQQFAKICFGILIVEDLFAVLMMVILSSIGESGAVKGGTLIAQFIKLAAYLILWFVLGIWLLPTLLRLFRKHLSDETLVILAVGLCLGMVLLATAAGFSSALGAFVIGSVLAETLEAERIEHLISPVKDIFGAIFFVSVGMLIIPQQLCTHAATIIILILLVEIGQITFATLGTLLSGASLKVSMQTAFSLTQIGEFAFIIAALGQQMGVMDPSLYPIAVAVSVITTFLTPFVIRLAEPAYNHLWPRLTPAIQQALQNYARQRNTPTQESLFRRLFKKITLTLLIYATLLSFLYILYFTYILPWLDNTIGQHIPTTLLKTIELTILLATSAPLLYAMLTAQRASQENKQMWHSTHFEKAKLLTLVMLRLLLPAIFVAYAISRTFTLTSSFVFLIALAIVIALLLSRRLRRNTAALTQQFNRNLSARERRAEEMRTISQQFTQSLAAYDIHIAEITLPPTSTLCGKNLRDLNIRNRSGATILRIQRSGININIPGGNTILFPADKIIIAGSDEQITAFRQLLNDSQRTQDTPHKRTHVRLQQFTITPTSPLLRHTIITAAIRDKAHCLIIAIERDGVLITNPEPTLTFQQGDIIVAAGETDQLNQFIQQNT